MGKALAACLVLAACQPMYGRSEGLKPPPRRTPPPSAVVAEAPLPYVEDCDVDFSARPTKQRQTPVAQQLVVSGNASLQSAGPQAPPATPMHVQAALTALTLYRDALLKDPYNAEATLKLALAYDRMLRKGCAIALLQRLHALSEHPKLEVEAKPNVELVVANTHWFRGYRIQALKAIGH